MVLFSAAFWYAYSSSEYSSTAKPQNQRMNFLRAIFDAMNPSDILLGIARAVSLLLHRRQGLGEEQYYAPATYKSAAGQYVGPNSYGRESPIERTTYGAYGLDTQSSPPLMYAAEGVDTSQSHLVANSRNARTPSPRRH